MDLRDRSILATLIHAPVLGEVAVLRDALVAVDGGGVIAAVHAREASSWAGAVAAAEAAGRLLRPDGILLPGLVDLHIHAPQYPQLGQALDLPLEDWLQRYTFPLEARYADLGHAARVYDALVGDLLAGQASTVLGDVVPSYAPGVTPADLSHCLPDYAVPAIREALGRFGRQIRGFDMADAVMTGVETRTSSPVRITRGADLQSLNTRGLYPAGEGCGYAGGIMTAGIDGIRVAEALALDLAG